MSAPRRRTVHRRPRRHGCLTWVLVLAAAVVAAATGAWWVPAVVGLGWLARAVHVYYLTRAISRGPGYFAGYEVRRQGRRLLWLLTRNWR